MIIPFIGSQRSIEKLRKAIEAIIEFDQNIDSDNLKTLANELVESLLTHDLADEVYDSIFQTFLRCGIRDEICLDIYLKVILGLDIPKKAVCKTHQAPFDLIADFFFERHSNFIGFASRTAGKTQNMAIISHLECVFKEASETTNAAAILAQSSKLVSYLRSIHTRSNAILDQIKGRITERLTRFKNSSLIESIVGSWEGLNSPHPSASLLDEVELVDWQLIQEAFSMPMSKNTPNGEIRGRQLFASTRKFLGLTFDKLLEHAKANEDSWQVYSWCCIESTEKCMRECEKDPFYGDCKIYDICQGRLKESNGFYKVDDLISKIKSLSKEVLDSQWFNLRPSRQKVVYADYWRQDVSLLTHDDFGGELAVNCIDWGSSKQSPTCFCQYLLDLSGMRDDIYGNIDLKSTERPKIYLVYEYRMSRSNLELLSQIIKESPHFNENMITIYDPSGRALKEELLRYVNLAMFIPSNKDVVSGIELVKQYLKVGKNGESHFYISPDYYHTADGDQDLVGTLGEFLRYQYRNEGDILPLPAFDHGLDCLRYLIVSIHDIIEILYQQRFDDQDDSVVSWAQNHGISVLS